MDRDIMEKVALNLGIIGDNYYTSIEKMLNQKNDGFFATGINR